MYKDYIMYGIVPNIKQYEQNKESFMSRQDNNKNDEVLNIIEESIRDEKQDEMFYKNLIDSTVNKLDKEIIMDIRDDERNHRKLLKEVYKILTGNDFVKDESDNNINKPNITYIDGLQMAFMNELKAFEKYRNVLMQMTERTLYNKIFEIMTDEMKHAIKYNYLINKNLK